MSDERLRELERLWKQTGAVEDEAAWLRERARIGSLDPEALDVCAILGVPAGLAATGREGPDLARFVDALDGHRQELTPRIGHAVVEAVLPAWEAALGTETGMEVIAKAIREQVLHPELVIDWPGLDDWVRARRDWVHSTRAELVDVAEAIRICAHAMAERFAENVDDHRVALEAAARAAGATAVRDRLVAELAPLLLGTGDPLAARSPDMSVEEFWALIEQARTPDGCDVARLTTLLTARPFAELIDFGVHFYVRWHQAYRQDLWDAAYLMLGGCSDDCFMDFRSGLIGLGRQVYEAALADPDSLADLGDLFVPREDSALRNALEAKCGGREAALPELIELWVPWPSMDPAGEGGVDDTAELKRRFPRLWALHCSNV